MEYIVMEISGKLSDQRKWHKTAEAVSCFSPFTTSQLINKWSSDAWFVGIFIAVLPGDGFWGNSLENWGNFIVLESGRLESMVVMMLCVTYLL